jgi:hypothetical protein
MRRDWLQTAAAAIRRNDLRNSLAGAVAGLGAALAIGGMEWLSVASHYPLVIIPFATSIVLVVARGAKGRRYDGLGSSLRFRSANRSPSRVSSTLRWWKASSVERCPIETMVVAGNFSSSSW